MVPAERSGEWTWFRKGVLCSLSCRTGLTTRFTILGWNKQAEEGMKEYKSCLIFKGFRVIIEKLGEACVTKNML